MRYYGKILGAILGWMLMRHPIGAVIGGLIGHAFDAGWFSAATRTPRRDPNFETLGIADDASEADVEQAYRRLMSQYHPDKVSNAAPEIRELAEQRAQSINSAYEAILRQRRAQR